jgi:HK97 family phage major capsid protein
MKVALSKASAQQLADLIAGKKNADPTFGQFIRALAAKHYRPMNAATAEVDKAAFKSITTGNAPGTYLVPEIQANEIVSLLSRGGILRKSGAKLLPCGSVRKFDIPVETGAVNVQYISENSAPTPVDPNFDQRKHVTKDLRALFFASNNLARTSVPVFDSVVRDIAAKAVARAEDQSFFAGLANGPTSVANIANVTTVNQVGSTLAYDDLINTIVAGMDSEGPIEDFVWYGNSQFFKKVFKLKDTAGLPLVKPCRNEENGAAFELLGFPLFISPTLPNHVGSGSASTFALFTYPQNIQIADGNLEVSLATEYAFEYDQVAVRIVAPRDFSLGQPSAAILLENIF